MILEHFLTVNIFVMYFAESKSMAQSLKDYNIKSNINKWFLWLTSKCFRNPGQSHSLTFKEQSFIIGGIFLLSKFAFMTSVS